jgi:hypothetical protein
MRVFVTKTFQEATFLTAKKEKNTFPRTGSGILKCQVEGTESTFSKAPATVYLSRAGKQFTSIGEDDFF